MTLSVVCPQEWRVASNGIDTRYEQALEHGKRVLEKFDCIWFMDFYDDHNAVCSYEFE